jgi:hypothetical protein
MQHGSTEFHCQKIQSARLHKSTSRAHKACFPMYDKPIAMRYQYTTKQKKPVSERIHQRFYAAHWQGSVAGTSRP